MQVVCKNSYSKQKAAAEAPAPSAAVKKSTPLYRPKADHAAEDAVITFNESEPDKTSDKKDAAPDPATTSSTDCEASTVAAETSEAECSQDTTPPEKEEVEEVAPVARKTKVAKSVRQPRISGKPKKIKKQRAAVLADTESSAVECPNTESESIGVDSDRETKVSRGFNLLPFILFGALLGVGGFFGIRFIISRFISTILGS